MAIGQTDPNDPGSWQQRPPIKEIDSPPEQTTPPSSPAGTAATPDVPVTVAYVAEVAANALPNVAAFEDYLTFSQETLGKLSTDVLSASGIDYAGAHNKIQSFMNAIAATEKDLNKKNVPAAPVPNPNTWPPLPRPAVDDVCSSTFDVNDLAMRGRKSMLGKQFHLPVIYPDAVLATNQKWAFGQKVQYRQEWRHEGFTLGELISSLSLLPNEELTLEVSSWQRTRKEVQEELTEEERKQYERELKRTDEESVATEAMANNGWSLSATGSVNYGPVSASGSASATGSLEQRTQQAERHVTEETTKATNQVSLRRAVRMTQSAEAGSESRTTRRIKNPNGCHTVTFNFFQIVKLFDVQLRLLNDAPTVMLPGLFPAFYTPVGNEPLRPVVIPYWVIESFNSPAVFLTRFFEVDRDLSQDINGWGLRVRIDVGTTTAARAAAQLAEALIIAVKYLLKLDPAQHIPALGKIVANYFQSTQAIRERNATTYAVGRGRSEQVTTPGVYVDSLLGRCSACEENVEAGRYVEVMRQQRESERLKAENDLLEMERQRRVKLLEAKKLDPFELPAGSVATNPKN